MHKLKVLFIVCIVSLLLTSCEDEEDIKHLNSFPHWNNSLIKDNEVYLFFAKELGQAIFPNEQHRPLQSPKKMPAVLRIGGLSTIGSYFKVIKEQFGNQSLIISGPPLIQRTNSSEKNNLILSSLAQMPIDATLFSHQELIASKKMSSSELVINWLNSNILSIKKAENIKIWDNVDLRILDRGPIKIGLIGIAELDNISEEQKHDLQGQYFKGAATTILELKQRLKKAESKFNVLIYNGKNKCNDDVPLKYISFSDIKEDSHCLKDSALEKILSKLPPNLVHLVIVTKGNFTRGKIAQIPVIGNPNGTLYISGVKLAFDELGKLEEKSSLFMAPVKYCQQMFAGLEDCQFSHFKRKNQQTRLELLEKTAFGLIQAKFLGHEIKKNELIEAIITGTVKIQSQDK